MSDIKWASLISKPEKVYELSDDELVYYHGIVAQTYYNKNFMLPGGYISAIRGLYRSMSEELIRRIKGAAYDKEKEEGEKIVV